MKVLIVGSGGREHALTWKIAQSPRVQRVYAAPGNGGTASETKTENIAISADDIPALLTFARSEAIDLTVVGPEAPLVAGIVDEFQAAGLRILGPAKKAARLEGSKRYAKDFLSRHRIPTAAYASFTDADQAIAYVRRQGAPIVIKADGLAAGKGVIIARTQYDAAAAIQSMLIERAFGEASRRVIVEEYLAGNEASFICMVRHGEILPLATAQDHKALGDWDTGPNTGGMGAYSPAPVVTSEVHTRIMREIIEPTVAGMISEHNPYTGFLYAGLMIGADGAPKVLEFNCRLGDPETQPILLRLKSDLAELCLAAIDGALDSVTVDWDTRAALGVVMTAAGYPGAYSKGEMITGLPVEETGNTKVFHAGTAGREGHIVTDGGRVLCVTALANSIAQAQADAYALVRTIDWAGAYFRTDIGSRAVNKRE
jgi:phosphoribosylamine--glycine ligase